MKIQVTQKHIDQGAACSNKNCPVALALRDDPEVTHSSVGRVTCTVTMDDDSYATYTLPWEAILWIMRFDEGAPVEPFEFEI